MLTRSGFRYVFERQSADALDAYRTNLNTLLGILRLKDIEHFVVASSIGSQPVIGMPRAAAIELLAALGTFQEGPIYVRIPRNGKPARTRLAQGVRRPSLDDLSGSFLVFSYVRNTSTGRRHANAYECQINIWEEESDGSLRRPKVVNSPIITKPAREEPRWIEIYGESAVTYEPLDQPTPQKVPFPVDVVDLWVDASDPAWRAKKEKRLGARANQDDADAAFLHRQADELQYSLRSLERFAPWVRKVYLVTDDQRPAWLVTEGTNLEVVDHTAIFPARALPTFNSHAITASVHNIPGISEHFLLMNDDILFGRPTPAGRFFLSDGMAKFFPSNVGINPSAVTALSAARQHTCDVIERLTGDRPTNVMKHTPVAFSRRLLESLAQECRIEWERTVHSPFRSPTDVVPSWLHHHVGHHRNLTKRASISYAYFGIGSPLGLVRLKRYAHGRPCDVFCVNDLGSPPDRYEADFKTVKQILEGELPNPSRYESPDLAPLKAAKRWPHARP